MAGSKFISLITKHERLFDLLTLISYNESMKEKDREIIRKLNILQVHNFYQLRGGEDAVVEKEAGILRQQGHKVVPYYRYNKDINSLPFWGKVLLLFSSVFSCRTYREVRKLIREQKIDLVHVHNTLHLISPSVFWAAKKENIPVVMTVHNFRLCCPNGLFYRGKSACEECMEKGLLCAVRHRCYRNSSLQTLIQVLNTWVHRKIHTYRDVDFICFTEFQKQKICSLLDVDEKHVWIKPNVCENIELAYANQENRILYAGRLSEEKGIGDLVRAYRQLVARMQKTGQEIPELVICGEGPLSTALQQYVRKHKLTTVVFTGQVSEKRVQEEIQKSGCVVLPSRCYEGMPMVLVKAYQMKRPVIVPDFGCFTSLVENGVNGFRYQPYDVQKLQEMLYDFLTQKEGMACSFYTSDLMEDTECAKNYDRLMQIYFRAMEK